MTRIKRGNCARKRRKKILKLTQGFRGSSSTLFRTSKQQSLKALNYSYRDRQQKKRQFRNIWISRISAISRFYGINYSIFIHKLKKANMFLNRKVLAQLAIRDQKAFIQLLQCL